MIFELTNLSTGEAVEWHAAEGELIDVIGHWFPLSGTWQRDLPTRRIIYKLQWATRAGRNTNDLEKQLGVYVEEVSN